MIDDSERARRQHYLGSSDAAAIVGRDPWRGPTDVWLEKTGAVAPEAVDRHDVRALGTYLEPAVLAWCEDELGVRIVRDQRVVHPNAVMAANLDGIAPDADPPCLVEAKTSGLLGNARFADDFGDHDTDELPAHMLLQVAHQLAVVNADPERTQDYEWAVVPVLLARRGFVLYRVRRDPELEGALVDAEERFWRDHVVPRVAPPEGPPPQLEVLKRLVRVPEQRVTISGDLVIAYEKARLARLMCAKVEDEKQRELLAALGIAEAGEAQLVGGKRYLVTYLQQTRKAYTVPESTYRALRVKELKA